jgi:hypothetical protein
MQQQVISAEYDNAPPHHINMATEESIEMTREDFLTLYHSMASTNGHERALKTLSNPIFKKNLKIPNDLWKAMSAELQSQIDALTKRIRGEMAKPAPKNSSGPKPARPSNPSTPAPLPHQYPSKTKANQPAMEEDEDEVAPSYSEDYDDDDEAVEEEEDEEMQVSANMTLSNIVLKAHLEYIIVWNINSQDSKIYAISDSGADATMVGKNAKVIAYSGRRA